VYRQAVMSFACAATVVAATTLAASRAPAQSLEDRVVEHRLDNGMVFLLVPRPEAPVFAGTIIVRVGGVDEPAGKTGLAHMFEHMAFKGTPWIGTRNYSAEERILGQIDSVAALYDRALAPILPAQRDVLDALERRTLQTIMESGPPTDDVALADTLAGALAETLRVAGGQTYPSLDAYVRAEQLAAALKRLQAVHRRYVVKDEFSQIVRVNGGADFNAGTSKDYTIYYEQFPSNQLELWAMLESERFLYPVLREFYSERDVVIEERRMRTDDDPEGKLYEQFLAMAFIAHPYRVPTIGWTSDLQQFTAEDAAEFRRRYYVPSNAVGVLVGDFDVGRTTRLIDQYFGRIPRMAPAPEVRTQEPPQDGERRVEVEFNAEPIVMIGYHKPNYPAPDAYVFSVIANILRDSGPSSRLYRRLVKTGIARDVSIYEETPGSRYPNIVMFAATPIAPHTTAEIEGIIYDELDSLARTPVSEIEFEKVKNQLQANYIRDMTDNGQLAELLADAQAVHGDWRLVATHREIVSRVTPDDVMRVARTYFTKENRTVATLVRPGGTTGAALAPEGDR